MFYKPEIRRRLRARRQHLDKTSIEQAALRVTAQVIHIRKFIESQTVAFYLPQENELDPQPTIRCALDLKKKLYLPVAPPKGDKVLQFYSYHPDDPLITNRYQISEPDPQTQIAIDRTTLDIIFVPLVSFDKDCNRLGRGAGYYDHTLAFIKTTSGKKPILIGLGYEFQKIPKIEASQWDVPLDFVVTEENIYQRG